VQSTDAAKALEAFQQVLFGYSIATSWASQVQDIVSMILRGSSYYSREATLKVMYQVPSAGLLGLRCSNSTTAVVGNQVLGDGSNSVLPQEHLPEPRSDIDQVQWLCVHVGDYT
jgi:hypothetical protein